MSIKVVGALQMYRFEFFIINTVAWINKRGAGLRASISAIDAISLCMSGKNDIIACFAAAIFTGLCDEFASSNCNSS